MSTLAVAGAGVLSGPAVAQAATPKASEPDGPLLDGTDVVAHVIDARKGEISILVGTREITYTDRALAQTLMRATQ